jgi:LCP family protein required for cell wall assembly
MSDGPASASIRTAPHRPWLAALLSFVLPGLGQAYAGRWRIAAILAAPMVALGAVMAGTLTGALTQVREALFSREVLTAILVGNGIVLAWRGLAIADAGLTPWRQLHGRTRRTAVGSVAGLLVLTVAMHVWIGALVVQLDTTLEQVFSPDDDGTAAVPPDPSGAPANPDPDEPPAPAWDGTERINVLLLGTDAAPGREVALTDVVLVVSVDPVERTAVMISIPRDTGMLPLPDASVYADGLYPDKVNSIMARAAGDPDTWCPTLIVAEPAIACGVEMMERVVGLYLGIQVHHHAIVDMAGFAEMIDAIGGIHLCLPGRLVDPEFDSAISDRYADGLILPAGCGEYDGIDALAYARSRKGWIELADGRIDGQSDFDRAERQQRVLLAMRAELGQADTLIELPGLLRAIGRTMSTDVQRSEAAELASLLPLITGLDIDRVVLDYPEFVDVPPDADTNYLLIPRRDAIRERMSEIFGASELEGWYLGTDDDVPAAARAGAPATPGP